MKRLNRKGFTLVELLAVIVILAIVVGITMVTVLPTLSNARKEAFELTAQTAADYLEKQYQLSLVGSNLSGDTLEMKSIPKTATAIKAEEYEQAGLKAENYLSGTWYIDTNTGRACVTLTASPNGEYYDVKESVSSTGC